MKTDRPSVRFLACFLWRGARQQDHQIGIFGAAGPDLLAVDDVAVIAFALGESFQRRGIGAAGRLGDPEGLQPQFAAGDLRQPFCLLLVAAMPQQRAHGVHLGMAAAAIAARALDLFEDRGGRGQFQSGAADILPGSAPRDSRLPSAHRRKPWGKPSRGRACASIRRGIARTVCRRRRGCRHIHLVRWRSVMGPSMAVELIRRMVGTAQTRLCPPYDPRSQHVGWAKRKRAHR